jgi:prevent-host-death family protein
MTKSVPRAVGIHEAKTHLSRLINEVRAGREIVIERRGEPVARLVPATPLEGPRSGTARGQVVVADDFDAPLPDDLAEALDG